jgi:MSHA biogenesis protein MshP
MSCDTFQRGFSLPIAIFILVIMALIGTALVSLSQSSHQALGQEVISTRAFYAAESGAQVALAQLFPLTAAPANCAAPYPPVVFTASDLNGCTASVTCSSTTISGKSYYTLTSTGTCGFATLSATRQIELMAKTP